MTNGLAFEPSPGASARWLSRPPLPELPEGEGLIGHIPFSFWVSDFDVVLNFPVQMMPKMPKRSLRLTRLRIGVVPAYFGRITLDEVLP